MEKKNQYPFIISQQSSIGGVGLLIGPGSVYFSWAFTSPLAIRALARLGWPHDLALFCGSLMLQSSKVQLSWSSKVQTCPQGNIKEQEKEQKHASAYTSSACNRLAIVRLNTVKSRLSTKKVPKSVDTEGVKTWGHWYTQSS